MSGSVLAVVNFSGLSANEHTFPSSYLHIPAFQFDFYTFSIIKKKKQLAHVSTLKDPLKAFYPSLHLSHEDEYPAVFAPWQQEKNFINYANQE